MLLNVLVKQTSRKQNLYTLGWSQITCHTYVWTLYISSHCLLMGLVSFSSFYSFIDWYLNVTKIVTGCLCTPWISPWSLARNYIGEKSWIPKFFSWSCMAARQCNRGCFLMIILSAMRLVVRIRWQITRAASHCNNTPKICQKSEIFSCLCFI